MTITTRAVRILRPCAIYGQPRPEGQVLDLPEEEAAAAVAAGDATFDLAPPPAPAPAPVSPLAEEDI